MSTRKAEIVDLLRRQQAIRVRALALRFDVSEMTIRRDLDDLEANGLIVRTHGGAVPTPKLRSPENPDADYAVAARKRAIGQLAARLVGSKQTIMVDSGTTTLEVARHIPQDLGIAMATTSLRAAQLLYGSPIDVVILGGMLRKEFPSVYGPIAESVLRSFHVDILFVGCDGAHSIDGFYTTESLTSALEQAMIRSADRVVLVTESMKFGRHSFVRFAAPGDIDVLVTDDGLRAEDRANLEAHGVEIMIAEEA